MMRKTYFIREEKGGWDREIWHGPYETMPKRELKFLIGADPNERNDFTVYRCEVVPVEWEKI
jgi:hypothetical protein